MHGMQCVLYSYVVYKSNFSVKKRCALGKFCGQVVKFRNCFSLRKLLNIIEITFKYFSFTEKP